MALPVDINDSPNYTSDDHAAHHNEVHGYVNGVTANRQTGSYSLVLTDVNKVVEMNVAGANTLTVPPNSSVAFPVGTVVEVMQYGAGATTITPGSGVTLRSDGSLTLGGQYSAAALRKIATDEWHVITAADAPGPATMFVSRRQGGNATDWSVAGTTTYDTSAVSVRTQVGTCISASMGSGGFSDVTVTFPVAFSQPPVVVIGRGQAVNSSDLSVRAADVTATGFTASFANHSANSSVTSEGHWIAVGAA